MKSESKHTVVPSILQPRFTGCHHALNWRRKRQTTHSSILAGRTPWTEETGGSPSRGSQRIAHD